MLTQLKSFFQSLQRPSTRDMELAYLAGSSSRYDLECREREIDAGRFRKARFANQSAAANAIAVTRSP